MNSISEVRLKDYLNDKDNRIFMVANKTVPYKVTDDIGELCTVLDELMTLERSELYDE